MHHNVHRTKMAPRHREAYLYITCLFSMVPGGGLEPPRPCGLRILSPLRLPISPSGHLLQFSLAHSNTTSAMLYPTPGPWPHNHRTNIAEGINSYHLCNHNAPPSLKFDLSDANYLLSESDRKISAH